MVFVGMLSSCAGIMNSSYTSVLVRTSKPATVTLNGKSVNTIRNKAELLVPRQKKSLYLTVKADSLTKQVRIGYMNSAAFFFNIYPGMGLGMLIDKDNPKRWGYLPMVYVNMKDTLHKVLSFGPTHKNEEAILYDTLSGQRFSLPPRKKGDVVINLSFPYGNGFNFVPDGQSRKYREGFMGFNTGLSYFYADNRFLEVSASAMTDFPIPFPAPLDRFSEYETASSIFMSASNNHIIKDFSIGYGLSYALNTWNLVNTNGIAYFDEKRLSTSEGPVPIERQWNTLGLILSTHYRIGQVFNVGIVYRPSFVRYNTAERFKYEHTLSLDLGWRIRMFNIARKKR